MQERKYPVGIQTFERIRKENYLYIDKTDLVWKLTKESPFVFLSRPRRFGKSLLTTTLDSYFQCRKDLFEGLKIMALEKEWEAYPVIHLDVSCAKNQESAAGLREALLFMMKTDMYVLSIPNNEVRVGLVRGLIPAYFGLDGGGVRNGFAVKLWQALKRNDIDGAMQEMKAFLASIPYAEGFKKKMEAAAASEGFYEYTFWLIFNMLNVFALTQVKCAGGRIDFVVQMPTTTYDFELKVHGTAQEALDQINSKGYALPYQTEGRKVIKVGVQFDCDTMTGNIL